MAEHSADLVARLTNLVLDLRAEGARVDVKDGYIDVDGSAAVLTDERMSLLREHKNLIVRLFKPSSHVRPFTNDELRRIAASLETDDRRMEARLGPDLLPPDPSTWPEPWRLELERRVECLMREGGLTHEEATLRVEPFIRRWAREEVQGG